MAVCAQENTQGGGVLNCKQRFLDTPEYQELLEWVTERVNKYWEKHFDDFTQQVVRIQEPLPMPLRGPISTSCMMPEGPRP